MIHGRQEADLVATAEVLSFFREDSFFFLITSEHSKESFVNFSRQIVVALLRNF